MVILLDIDGVMVPANSWKAPALLSDGFPDFSPKAVKGLNKILFKTGASITLTTSHKSRFAEAIWKQIFTKRGIDATISILNTTLTAATRKEEIMQWAQMHPGNNDFVIIDDDTSLNDLPAELKKRFILTSPLIGLTENLADQAIAILCESIAVSV